LCLIKKVIKLREPALTNANREQSTFIARIKKLIFVNKNMSDKKHFTIEEAKIIGDNLGIMWDKFDVEQFRMGLDVELEHGLVDSNTNVTNDDPELTGMIALAHLNEFADYYTRLEKLEEEAEEYWNNK
jgi:hypothetical protein